MLRGRAVMGKQRSTPGRRGTEINSMILLDEHVLQACNFIRVVPWLRGSDYRDVTYRGPAFQAGVGPEEASHG